ncbi:hypothetical protein TEA_027153 [Camellia sinensis var. sinensis]|uniref:Methyltransferase type 11 domain-containing protein n=1 Tax=Camellia sinensis var. sinensis TaxID=542762 RepID=A0A4S4E1Z2_CAMSN|nr:hypothetical protein TEA_027153 [Camellia sinensis var. sinensis]
MSRPEVQAPPEIFYNDEEARKYTSSSRIIQIQAKLSERALELLALPDDGVPRLLLDIGCGSGLSGETLSENGHQWIGLDISQSMLSVALEREAEGDLILGDMGQGLGFRPGVIDGAISISAVQVPSIAFSSSLGVSSLLLVLFIHCFLLVLSFLFFFQYAAEDRLRAILKLAREGEGDQSKYSKGGTWKLWHGDEEEVHETEEHGVESRAYGNVYAYETLAGLEECSTDEDTSEESLLAFFGSLYRCLARGARAVFQVYPESVAQRELILSFAMRAGFAGGVVVDFPHSTKSRKEYLVLTCGPPSLTTATPKAIGEDEESCSEDETSEDEENETVCISDRHRPRKKQKITKKGKGREWVLRKKEQMRKRGNVVPPNTNGAENIEEEEEEEEEEEQKKQ